MLTLYRRHASTCPVHKTKLNPREKRYYMDCACPLWMYGNTETKHYPRQALGTSDLKAAEAIRSKALAKERSIAHNGPRISDCVAEYIGSRHQELNEKTVESFELRLGKFGEWCEQRNLFFMAELNISVLERYKAEGMSALKPSTRAMSFGKVRSFLRDAFRREWIAGDLAGKVKPLPVRHEAKEPYTSKEVETILAEAGAMDVPTTWGGHPTYTATTFRLLLELMLETGMRVSDAVSYDPQRTFRGDAMWVYAFIPRKTEKKRRQMEAFLGDSLKKAIDGCEWAGPRFPFKHQDANLYVACKEVWRRMQAVGKKCGIKDCRPHRLRDTFAVNALLRGVSISDVSHLLGHSSVTVTEMFYAAWTRDRAARLEGVLAKSLIDSSGNGFGNKKD